MLQLLHINTHTYINREDLRRWFLKQESDLFRFRLERLDAQ